MQAKNPITARMLLYYLTIPPYNSQSGNEADVSEQSRVHILQRLPTYLTLTAELSLKPYTFGNFHAYMTVWLRVIVLFRKSRKNQHLTEDGNIWSLSTSAAHQ